jgi:PEP-CTERM motif
MPARACQKIPSDQLSTALAHRLQHALQDKEAGLMWGKSFAAALLTATMLSTGSAWALAIVATSAGTNDFSSSIGSAQDPNLVNEPHVSARSRATELSTESNAVAGFLPTCLGQAQCAVVGTDAIGTAFASANGNNGTLRAGAETRIHGPDAGGDVHAAAGAGLIDTIRLNSTIVEIFVDVTAFSTPHASGGTAFFFSMAMILPETPEPEDTEFVSILDVEAFRDGSQDEESFSAHVFGELVESGTSVPGSFHFEIDLAQLFASPFPNIPPLNPADTPITLGFGLDVEAGCDGDPCTAESRLENTLYIKLDGQSESGYSYPGRELVDPPPTGEIPEPASGLMLLGGLAGLAAGLRRRRVRT